MGSVLLSKAISKSYSSSLSLIPSSLRRFPVIFWTFGSLVLPEGVVKSWVVVMVVDSVVATVELENPVTGNTDDNRKFIVSRTIAAETPQKEQILKHMVRWFVSLSWPLRDMLPGQRHLMLWQNEDTKYQISRRTNDATVFVAAN
jgi:hypothetical protein